MEEARIAGFDGVDIRVYHSGLRTDTEFIIIVLPLATKASLIESAVNRLSCKYNVITWEARLILEPDAELRNRKTLSIESNTKDLVTILDYFDIPIAFLIGYCSGAATALHAAAAYDFRIKKMALVNGAYFMGKDVCDLTQYEKDVMDLMPTIAADYNQASYIFTKFFEKGALFNRSEHEFVEEISRPYDNLDSFYRLGIGLSNFIVSDLKSIARGIKIPTLIATGKLDNQTHYSSSILVSSEMVNGETYIDEVGDHYEFCRAKPELMERIFKFFSEC